MQPDHSYLRQYARNGLLLYLDPHLGIAIDTDTSADNVLSIGALDDATYAIPASTNAGDCTRIPTCSPKWTWKRGEGGERMTGT